MSTTVTIRDIPVTFPFKPYDIQTNYMEKVIECLQNGTNGVLESPTGTGKTLSLLCSSLAWLSVKKAQIQVQQLQPPLKPEEDDFLSSLQTDLKKRVGNVTQASKAFYGVPTIIYASRTHSQLSQAMQELKRTAYRHMKSTVVGSRDQLCINEEVMKEESNSAKIHMCQLKVKTRTCFYYNKVEKFKEDARIREVSIMDIEDLVKAGQQHKFCPYFMSKELKQHADIVFMPYNYILDIRTRKSLGIELSNTVVILDEAHNVDKMCEESASVELKSSDVTLCIEEVTGVMKAMSSESIDFHDDSPKDFTADELCILKQVLLDFEKAIDSITLTGTPSEGTTLEGDYIYEIFKNASVQFENSQMLENLIDKILQFLSTVVPDGPFQRKGNGLEHFQSLLKIVFATSELEYRTRIKKCYKVHLIVEEVKKKFGGNDWLSKASLSKKNGRILSFWCFSPGFGMTSLMTMGVKSVILTSGTLAPLQPLITELQLTVPVRLENPHIVKGNQICVKIVTKGPDGVPLNSSFQNRNCPKYISSLGRTILNLVRIIPNGLLIFFPSYPIMLKCQQEWQMEGIWTNICDQKAIYVEPKQKEAFNIAMIEYYNRINNPQYKGAIFMGVCRGKVSEGLDFADINGRAVIVTGLPYPPFKDPKVVLKKKYVDECRKTDKSYLTSDEWYSLEASRAVNQAIGRVIRHQNDYGAIILLDSRFTGFRIKSQLSLWLRDHIRLVNNFGEIIRDLRNFFRNAEINFPVTKIKVEKVEAAKFDTSEVYVKKGNFDFGGSSSLGNGSGSVGELNELGRKRKRITVVSDTGQTGGDGHSKVSIMEYIFTVKKALNTEDFKAFLGAVTFYRDTAKCDEFISMLDNIFLHKHSLRYIIQGLQPFIKAAHKIQFDEYWEKMR